MTDQELIVEATQVCLFSAEHWYEMYEPLPRTKTLKLLNVKFPELQTISKPQTIQASKR